ncbi:MAG: hypothetical protein MHM6MM_007094, partial [Cercozoa sp. M6MM]
MADFTADARVDEARSEISQFATKVQERFTQVERALTPPPLQRNAETMEAVRHLQVKLERLEERLK